MWKYPLITVVIFIIVASAIFNASASTINPDLNYLKNLGFDSGAVDDYIDIDSFSPAEFHSDQATKDYLTRNELRVRAYDYRIEKFQEDAQLEEAASDEEINAFPERYEKYTRPTKEKPSPYENIFDIWERQ